MVANEIQFLSWKEFRRMAPGVLRLEVSRLGTLIQDTSPDSDVRNTLVKARFDLKRFVACLERADAESVERDCAAHLRSALLALSMERDESDEEMTRTRAYIVDRIKYVHDRIGLTY